jgi:hypothetical protein
MSLHPFGELRHQRTKPPALLNGVGRPIPLPIVPIPGALWRPWAKPAVQAAPPAAADGRALAGRPALVLAPHRGAVSRLASRVWTVWFKGLISEFPCPPPTALELGTKCRKCRKCTKPWLKSFLHLLHLLTACFLHFCTFCPFASEQLWVDLPAPTRAASGRYDDFTYPPSPSETIHHNLSAPASSFWPSASLRTSFGETSCLPEERIH